jgi:hypothetical protein
MKRISSAITGHSDAYGGFSLYQRRNRKFKTGFREGLTEKFLPCKIHRYVSGVPACVLSDSGMRSAGAFCLSGHIIVMCAPIRRENRRRGREATGGRE